MRIELQKKLVIGIEIDSEHSYIFCSGKSISLIPWGKEIEGKEKYTLLGWHPGRIIKTIFLEGKDSKIYGAVVPLDKKVDLKSLADYLKISKREASKLKLSKRLPYLQKAGAAGPFICDKDLSLVEKIIFEEEAYKGKVDFSYPGKSEVSIQMDYEDAIEMLLEKYYDKIEIGKISSSSTLEKRLFSLSPLIVGPDGFVCSSGAKSEDFDRRYFGR